MRRTPLRRVGRRKKRLRQKGLVGPLAEFVRGEPCCVPGCHLPGDPHHIEHGTLRLDWTVVRGPAGDVTLLEGAVVPLCRAHHDEMHHELGHTLLFERAHPPLDLAMEAAWWGETFQRLRPDVYRQIMEAA